MPPRPPRTATLFRLIKLARPERSLILWGMVLLIVSSATSLLYPQGMRVVIDTALGTIPEAVARLGLSRRELVNWAAFAMASVALLQAAAGAGRFYLFTIAGERTVTRLRSDLYRRILDQEVAFFDGERTGELMNRLSGDATVLQSAVSANISMALRNLVQAMGGIVLLFFTSPMLATMMIGVVPAIAVSAVAYGRRVRRLSKEVQDRLADAGAVAEESLSGLRTVRSFAAEDIEHRRYGKALDDAYALTKTRARASATFFAFVSFAGYAAAALVFWYGGRLVSDNRMSAGQLTSFLVYTLIVGFSLGALADLWADFMKAAGAAERVFALLDRTPMIAPSGGERPADVVGHVELDGVRFVYPTRPEVTVLDRLDLTLRPGEVVAVVGPSGAGKSTIAALLARFYDPSEGSVRLDRRDLRALDPDWLRRQIGTVAQEPILFSTTVAENIRYGRPDASDADVESAAALANADRFIRAFPEGYKTLVGERGVQLSGGQKQRVAIARAILKDPKILILDEATSALDAENEHLVREALDHLMRGRTTLVIAHRLSTVAGANRVIVLDAGRVVQSGTHAALMAEGGLYKKLVERQFVAA
ncbi:MAG TPA: ABC transporter transmembrane domain-containing protein [Kofleriaceae bacterium]|nr:ABC transporter transmembrane domain-containing protein [Kofleriaceae bacterium]